MLFAAHVRWFGQQIEPPTEVEEVIDLGRRTEGDVEKPCIVAFGATAATFCDIGRNRYGGPSHLSADILVVTTESAGLLVHGAGEFVGEVEGGELGFVSAHAAGESTHVPNDE